MTGILIVDDHAGFRTQARALLEAAGYEVVGEAVDAAGAIRAVGELHPDALLLDVQLPDHDGFWVADRLAAHDARPRIVLISSRRADDYGSALAGSATDGFIHKPDLSRDVLEELIGAPS